MAFGKVLQDVKILPHFPYFFWCLKMVDKKMTKKSLLRSMRRIHISWQQVLQKVIVKLFETFSNFVGPQKGSMSEGCWLFSSKMPAQYLFFPTSKV